MAAGQRPALPPTGRAATRPPFSFLRQRCRFEHRGIALRVAHRQRAALAQLEHRCRPSAVHQHSRALLLRGHFRVDALGRGLHAVAQEQVIALQLVLAAGVVAQVQLAHETGPEA
ncbi:hypothetical protein G6F65_021291 [Rhizopus arrhizus]|nr:hypothetical protein G6F24_018479 [Rhizopus arrhizus]KAG1245327.1 hypothetical protein G6F65_021291 [Rhizopus arrhizus]